MSKPQVSIVMGSDSDLEIMREAGKAVEVSFALLTLPRIWIRANVSWRKPKHSFGVRFDPADERRRKLKEWIDAYMES